MKPPAPAAAVRGILLAAGRSERFGSPKLLAPLRAPTTPGAAATPMALVAYRNLTGAVRDCVVVVRPAAAALAAALRAEGAIVVECARADEGMGASLACGVAATREAGGWIVALADMPWIAVESIRAVGAALAAGASIAAPTYRGERGHPVGFAAAHRAALLALTGDQGARAVLAVHHDEVRLVPVDDPGVLRDVDVPGDLR